MQIILWRPKNGVIQGARLGTAEHQAIVTASRSRRPDMDGFVAVIGSTSGNSMIGNGLRSSFSIIR